jgi:peptidoglycan/xylan/chitin deacetylase (PgdA/CDA1 family)
MKFIFVFSSLVALYLTPGNSIKLQNTERPKQVFTKAASPNYKQIPVLCYHNIKINPGKEDLLRIDVARFDEQMEFLYKSGYHTISPDQLYRHLTLGTSLPANPIMISFDDSHEEQFSIAKPILDKYGFKGVFFIMTVCINKPKYLTAMQIKELSREGHAIENHTWDHQKMTLLHGKSWEQEIDKPKERLEKITGTPIEYFAYPYGLWDETAIMEWKRRNIKAAFQLSGRLSKSESLYTIRRIMVSGQWSPAELKKQIEKRFEKDSQEFVKDSP